MSAIKQKQKQLQLIIKQQQFFRSPKKKISQKQLVFFSQSIGLIKQYWFNLTN
jgi:hypothetical protein